MSADAMWSTLKKAVGFVDEEGDDLDPEGKPHDEPLAPTRRGSNNKIVGLPSTPNSEVMIIEPKSFEESLNVVAALHARKAVILNLVGMEADQAQRLVDFVSGATHALSGNQQRIGDSIFLFTPTQMAISSLHGDAPWIERDARDLFWRVK